MTSTLTTIARTISEELERAVAAAEDAQNAGLNMVNDAIKTAIQRHSETIDSAVELEREAASMIAAAVKVRENAQKALYEAMADTHSKVQSLRSEAPRRMSSKKAKAISQAASTEGQSDD